MDKTFINNQIKPAMLTIGNWLKRTGYQTINNGYCTGKFISPARFLEKIAIADLQTDY
jgi:hypothetical protein